MPDTLLISSASDLVTYKHITMNVDTNRFAIYSRQAQELDLRKLLGTELYLDLLDDYDASPQLTKYSDLFNGSTYTKNDRKFKHEGLIPVLANYIYARYVRFSGSASTPFGMVQKKQGDVSEGISNTEKGLLIGQAQSEALAYWERVQIYLYDHKDTITLYRRKARQSSGVTITGAGGNSKDKYKRRNY